MFFYLFFNGKSVTIEIVFKYINCLRIGLHMKILIGLGNPGREYQGSRHNIGFEIIDYLASQWGIAINQAKFQGVFGSGVVQGEKVILLKPLTYMNLSGICIRQVVDFYKVSISDIVLIYDDMDMEPGRLRTRQKGSAGGHNGIKSTIEHLGDDHFNRIKIGIGRPERKSEVTDFVLTGFHQDEIDVMRSAVKSAAEICKFWLKNDFVKVMNAYNGK